MPVFVFSKNDCANTGTRDLELITQRFRPTMPIRPLKLFGVSHEYEKP